MKLIDLLVKELPKRGGWPDGVDAVEQGSEGRLFEMESDYCSYFKLEKCDDWIADVVTKQQYEAALADSEDRMEQDLNECIGQDVDVVNHPPHYTQGDIECIDAIKAATVGKTGIEAVAVANVFKYLWRYEEKNGLEDVKKAQWYLNKLISEMENK